MIERFKLNAQSQIVELASNDGYLLQYFVEADIPVSVLLFAIFDTVVVFFLFLRGMPKSTSTNPVYWSAGTGGSWASLLLQPAALTPGTSFLLIPQIAGIVISFAGLLSLNKSFGLLASNRGIRTTGMYRYIRHPLYAGYILTNVSFMIQHFSLEFGHRAVPRGHGNLAHLHRGRIPERRPGLCAVDEDHEVAAILRFGNHSISFILWVPTQRTVLLSEFASLFAAVCACFCNFALRLPMSRSAQLTAFFT